MKLHQNQLALILHLIRFCILDYESCLWVLDVDGIGDQTALSYQFRPLTKNKYLSKSKAGIVTVLAKGRELFPEAKPMLATGGGETSRQRVLQVSRMCTLMERNGIAVVDEILDEDTPHFIPSACWRKIAPGILSTTRFVGMLLNCGKKYAVYDIGDGNMEWQVRAEGSLFYRKYSSYETCADGMILVCDDGERNTIARQIIQRTMWNRKALLNPRAAETNKPQRVSKAPIKLKAQYAHVYLTTKGTFSQGLERIRGESMLIDLYAKRRHKCSSPGEGDLEDWPHRYFINPGCDLLKLAYFFSAVKSHQELLQNPAYHVKPIQYHIVLYLEDLPLLDLYPDVRDSEGVKKHVLIV